MTFDPPQPEEETQRPPSSHRDIDLMLQVGTSLINAAEPTRLNELASKALEQSTAVHYAHGQAYSRYLLGEHYLANNDLTQAITHLEKATQITRQTQDKSTETLTLWGLMRAHNRLADYAAVLEYARQRLEICEALHAEEDQARTLNFIGIVYIARNMDEEASTYLERALHIARRIEDDAGIARSAINLTDLYSRNNKFDKAEFFGQMALGISTKLDEHDGIARSLANLARVSMERGDYATSRTQLEEAWAHTHTQQTRPQDQIIVLCQWGELYLKLADSPAAIKTLQRALPLAELTQTLNYQRIIHRKLARAYQLAGDYERAIHHFERYEAVREQIHSEEQQRRITKLEVRRQTESARRESAFYQSRTQELEQMHEQNQQYFAELSRMQDDLLSTVSHDLKNPLSIILTSIGFIKRIGNVRDERGKRHVQIIEGQVDRMRTIVDNLLKLAHMEMKDSIDNEPFRLFDLVQHCIRDIQPEALHKQITLNAEVSPADLIVDLDQGQIRQAVNNLLSNAVKYTSDGGKVQVTAHRQDKHWFTIKITDTGIGIPTEDLPHIFERFYRVRDDTRSTYEGSGLGLAIVKAIVDRHHGMVSVNSTATDGTTFTLRLPVAVYASASDEKSAPA